MRVNCQGFSANQVLIRAKCCVSVQEAEYAEMLTARLESGKSASTSASHAHADAGIDNDSVFAGIHLDGKTLVCRAPVLRSRQVLTY